MDKEEKQRQQQAASAIISDNLKKIHELVKECQTLADEADVCFRMSAGGYGMGGTYKGKNIKKVHGTETEDEDDEYDEYDYMDSGWNPSSERC